MGYSRRIARPPQARQDFWPGPENSPKRNLCLPSVQNFPARNSFLARSASLVGRRAVCRRRLSERLELGAAEGGSKRESAGGRCSPETTNRRRQRQPAFLPTPCPLCLASVVQHRFIFFYPQFQQCTFLLLSFLDLSGIPRYHPGLSFCFTEGDQGDPNFRSSEIDRYWDHPCLRFCSIMATKMAPISALLRLIGIGTMSPSKRS
jgi:hypothetical protein